MGQDWTRIKDMIIGRDIDPASITTALREQVVLTQLEQFPSSPRLLGMDVALADGRVTLVKDKEVAPGPMSEELTEAFTTLFECGVHISSATADRLPESESSLSSDQDGDGLDVEEPSSKIVEIGRTPASSVPLLAALEGINLVSIGLAEERRALLAELPPEKAGWNFGGLPLVTLSHQNKEFQVFLMTGDHPERVITHNWGMKTLLIADAHESTGELDQEILDFVSGRPDLEAVVRTMPGADLGALVESITSLGEDTVRRIARTLGPPAELTDFFLGVLPTSEVGGTGVHFARGVSNTIGRNVDVMLSDPESRAQPLWSTYQPVAVEEPRPVRTLVSIETIVGITLLTLTAHDEAPRSRWLRCGGFIGALLLVDSVAEVSLSSYLHRRHQGRG